MNQTSTCIVGIAEKGKVYLGSDSLGVSSGTLYKSVRTYGKVFLVGEGLHKMGIGYTTSFRMGQILEYELNLPEHPEGMDTLKYMIVKFIPEVKRIFAEKWTKPKDGEDASGGGSFLCGYKGRLFQIEGDFQVSENACKYDATGCGMSYSLGSLFTTAKQKISIQKRLELALQAAESFSAGVGSPFHFVTI